MVTTKNIREKPFNSGGEGKLLLDELMLTLHHNERMDISQGDVFTDIHEKTLYHNMCKMLADAGCECNKKSFMQESTVKSNVGRGKIGAY
jgi:hypothetical protein